MKRVVFAFALLVAGAGGVAAEQFYKWKDADGVWRYTITAPPAGVQSSRVLVSGGPRRPRAATEYDAAANADIEITGDAPAGSAGDGASTVAEGQERTAKAIAARRATACDNARKRFDVLANNAAVEWDRDGDGVAERLDVEAHAAEQAKAQQDIGFYCKRS